MHVYEVRPRKDHRGAAFTTRTNNVIETHEHKAISKNPKAFRRITSHFALKWNLDGPYIDTSDRPQPDVQEHPEPASVEFASYTPWAKLIDVARK